MSHPFPHIRIEGAPHERGVTYGRLAAERIGNSLALYRELFEAYASMQWAEAVRRAGLFEPSIKEYLPDALEEMHGIAEGAGVSYGDILALNCRSELMFALPDGCTSVIIPPEASSDSKTYIAQTWDWLKPAHGASIILEVHQKPLPALMMVCEAGMVGGKGVNSAGIGCGLNALGISRGRVGTPLHVMYRGVMNTVKISDAIEAVAKPVRAGCGNFYVGSAEGLAMHLEFTPDTFDVLMPDTKGLAHANHFLSPFLAGQDVLKTALPCSFPRRFRAQKVLDQLHGKLNRENVCAAVLSDHVNFPDSVCSHEDPRDAQWSRFCTVYGIFVDLCARALWVSHANPCEGKWEPFYLHPGA
ncbi:putative acyl-coenzyme A:6-aminopenicillanic acid acyl-transferase family protein [uncultured delta proteobacterium]|uniref:Putative acyl-coenzyme A:6-aminopenicillanic acid acyl-transferase family protein n=1 Tax=uncultured delta proteobacterium TaxID=34034 RepID=A0A212JDD9_9DELT|nr:putative acyl-coenzyme A:6-aminopenicillanic acid acyl-transferase family protein [uncultured delta proteobacterium]